MDVGLLLLDDLSDDALEVANRADQAGLHSVWTIDYYNRNSLVRNAAIAATTEQIRLGTSVTPAFARSPLVLANAAADIQRIARGRFTLGLGSSTRRMNADWYGVDLQHPAPQMIETVDLVRKIWAHSGGPFTFEGRFHNLKLAHFDTQPVDMEIFTAGVGERMVEVAGQVAQGFIGHPAAGLEYLQGPATDALARGAAKRTDGAERVKVALQFIASVDDDRETARTRLARQLGYYSTVKGYDAIFPDDDVDRAAIREAFKAGHVDEVGKLAMPLTERRGAYGTIEDVLQTLKSYEGTVDLAMLYSPHYGMTSEEVKQHELALVRGLDGR
jgi:alkanesulfonate monooxygenase SsuD/methylene tetrahydromethanopterin reductase-like flavin-dependent oxidoreductase (luciferase family)